MHIAPGEFTWRLMSVLCATEPLVPVIWSTKAPVEAVPVVEIPTVELAALPGGGVTG